MSDSDGADPTPSGSNSAPKPRRQRMQHSCDNCKKRKIRCDSAARGGNACSHCVALRVSCLTRLSSHLIQHMQCKIECQHTAQRKVFHKREGTPAGRSLHLKKDEAELRKILKELAGYIRILEKELAETFRISSVELGESEGQITSESSDNDEGDDELSKQLEELSFTYSRNRYYGPFNRIKLIKSAIDGKETNAGNQEPVQIFKRPLFWDLQPWQILPEPRLEPLIFGFEKSAPYFPLFHRPTLMKSISSGLHYYDRHFGETLLAMCALASRHSDDSRSFTYGSKLSAGFIWMQQVNPVPTSFLEPATLPQVQKLILYIMFMQTTSTPWPGWVLTGLVSGELWKRAFWTINYIDLSLALYVGRPRVVTPDDYDVDFPEEVDDEYWEQAW
ncbi:hypothetical protein BT96DRAFT_992196 [Gymnopus androsaceus JB14]|uniref:Zn(2)-C6 fungal-type domain-containing protein n=1 Tax=Gymnopus androsaceus JB14 TaxID=1447944 RepID=A0A6A4HU31_9AGAR|nr:hypothetical protein BT96DRAFT_992196 [Gymnopus androsaceus JB14]